jgi:hypothetical protein
MDQKQGGVKLWHLMFIITTLSLVLGILPQRIGIPIFFVIEGIFAIATILLFTPALIRKLRKQ